VTKLVIFDLDGTLIDSAEDIALSVNELREHMDRSPLPLDLIESYIGNGVRVLLERAFDNATVAVIDEAQRMYLPIYRRRLLDNTRAYPGVGETLEVLQEDGRGLAVLTNKPLRESLMILEGLGLRKHFRSVYGGDSFEHRKPDPVGVLRILDEEGRAPEEALFVGDTRVDLETARNAGIRSCLVSYGIRPESSAALEPDFWPDFWIDDMRELTTLVGVGA
jgi:phosphoglycolate phosphatase